MWIAHVPYEAAEGRLKTLYDRLIGPDGNVDNIMLAHSLRPHSMEGHMSLYKSVLHHNGNQTPKWFLEALGVFTSMLNACQYCVEHHFEGLRRLLGNDGRALGIQQALENETFDAVFDAQEVAALEYARALTVGLRIGSAIEGALRNMRSAGIDDGRILEINQVVAYFNYANRTVLGLGINTDGDVLGTSPGDSNSPDDWAHR